MFADQLQIALEILIQFTGDGGGHRPYIVPFGIGAMMWFTLLLVARFKYRPVVEPHEAMLVWGFAFAFGRELLMLLVKIFEAFSLLSIDQLHLFFPPAEHALSDISAVVVIAAYMLYLSGDELFSRRYLFAGVGSVVLIYLLTFWWWADFISANPESKFGQTWCDWIFRINASLWIGAGGIYLWRVSRGWTRNVVCIAIGLFFLDDFLKIPDMMLNEQYESTIAPIRNAFYLLGILLLGYVYLRGHARGVLESFNSLEITVNERTAELAAANEKLLELSRIDPLTQLANRRAFEQDFNKLRAGVSRTGSIFSIMLIDIDHFKQVNDTYGHPAGDACLVAMGEVLAKFFKRDNDIVARYGGEEFIAVLINESREATIQLAEKLREYVEANPVEISGDTIKLTISIGVATSESMSRDDTENLIALADSMLYQAKEQGRNRVCIG